MSRWTIYQIGTAFLFAIIIYLLNTPSQLIDKSLQWVNDHLVADSIFLIILTVVIGIWLIAFIFYCEEKKGNPLFSGKIWRVMPAIIGVSLTLSFFIFIALGLTLLTDITHANRWILHSIIIVFLLQLYMLTLSIYVRYNTEKTSRSKIISAANMTIIILVIVLFFIPTI